MHKFSFFFIEFPFGLDSSIVLPTLLSSIVLIALFVAGRFLDSLVERKRNAQEWYMKMVLEPNASAIHDYFQKALDQTRKISQELANREDFELKTRLFEELTVEKRKIEFNLILLVSKPYPKTADRLTEFVNLIHDQCTVFLDKGDYSKEKFDDLQKEIMAIKGDFFQEIYNPFRIKSTLLWIKKNYLPVMVILLVLFFLYIIGSNMVRNSEQHEEQEPSVKSEIKQAY